MVFTLPYATTEKLMCAVTFLLSWVSLPILESSVQMEVEMKSDVTFKACVLMIVFLIVGFVF